MGSPDRWRRKLVPVGRSLTLMRRERIVLNLIYPDIIVLLYFQEVIPDRLLLRILRDRSVSVAKETWSVTSHRHLSKRRNT